MDQLKIFGVNAFHDTTGESNPVHEQTAKYQDSKVLEFMRTHKRKEGWTSHELHEVFPQMLQTSIRRALTNISKDEFNPNGTVVRTKERRDGGYGVKVIVWQFYQHGS